MKEDFRQVEGLLGEGEKVFSFQPLSGGSVGPSGKLTLASGKSYFMKRGTGLLQEARGLRELSRAGVFRTPEIIHAGPSLLLLEWIEGKDKKTSSPYAAFGTNLARLHRHQGTFFGFEEDNFIGRTPQKNVPGSSDWTDFFLEYRLVFQWKLAEQNRMATAELSSALKKLEGLVEKILQGSEEAPALLHGDLWSGNYLVTGTGTGEEVVLIDPAVYYGHRESDLAMTTLFGRFPREFYQSYQEEFPLQEGVEYREPLYQLYHMLNHLNLFGKGYYRAVLDLIHFYL